LASSYPASSWVGIVSNPHPITTHFSYKFVQWRMLYL